MPPTVDSIIEIYLLKKKGKGQSLLLKLMAHTSSHILLVSVAWNIKENLKEWNKTNTTPPRWDAGMIVFCQVFHKLTVKHSFVF